MIRPPVMHRSRRRCKSNDAGSVFTNPVWVPPTFVLRTSLDMPFPGAYNPAKPESRSPIGESSAAYSPQQDRPNSLNSGKPNHSRSV